MRFIPRILRQVAVKRPRSRGQNLVELALTLPFIMGLAIFMVEIGRVWFVYEGAKMAAMEGAHAAAIYHNPSVGKSQLDNRLAATGLVGKTSNVTQIENNHAYKADVTVQYTPLFGGTSIPTISGPLNIAPSFDISYSAVEDVAVY